MDPGLARRARPFRHRAHFARQPQQQGEQRVPEDRGLDLAAFELLEVCAHPRDVRHRFGEQGAAQRSHRRPFVEREELHVDLGAGAGQHERLGRDEDDVTLQPIVHAPLLHLSWTHERNAAWPQRDLVEIDHASATAVANQQHHVELDTLWPDEALTGAGAQFRERQDINAHPRQAGVMEADLLHRSCGSSHGLLQWTMEVDAWFRPSHMPL